MSETLYRKYRPKNFSEIIGQAHIVRTLFNSIKNNRIGHAYLFTGPRGTGKTSIARILAKTINCANLASEERVGAKLPARQNLDGGGSIRRSEAKADSQLIIPCDKCNSCKIISSGKSLDIIEIDAASNTGVDNIRELRETVAVAPSSLKYKVYIIDEVHMLSTGAFNALLKTLEEPPSHVVFILATTEIHKVPETIISRCQRFDFTRLPIPNIVQKLALIAKAEKVKIEKEALEMMAIAAEGGMRDAESLLGQIISLEDKDITTREVEEILGTTDRKMAGIVARLIMEKKSSEAIAKINEILEEGYDLKVFNKSLVNYLRQLMLLKISPELKKYFSFEMPEEQIKEMIVLSEASELPQIISTINLLLEVQNKISSFILPQLPLEIAIIKATHVFPKESQEYTVEKNSSKKEPELKTENQDFPPKADPPLAEEMQSEIQNFEKPTQNNTETENTNSDATFDLDTIRSNWKKLLVDIRPYNHSLSALLTNCQPVEIRENFVVLATPYGFYQERLNDSQNKLTIEKVLSKILGLNVRIEVKLDKSLIPKKEATDAEKAEKPKKQNPLLNDALEIMGGKIVEE